MVAYRIRPYTDPIACPNRVMLGFTHANRGKYLQERKRVRTMGVITVVK